MFPTKLASIRLGTVFASKAALLHLTAACSNSRLKYVSSNSKCLKKQSRENIKKILRNDKGEKLFLVHYLKGTRSGYLLSAFSLPFLR